MTATPAPTLLELLDPDDLYAMRRGVYGQWRGVTVVGYLGIAQRLGFRTRGGDPAEQTARLLACKPGAQFPQAVFTVEDGNMVVQLFDWLKVREWAIQTGRLASDGVTPLRRRPRRGKARQAAM